MGDDFRIFILDVVVQLFDLIVDVEDKLHQRFVAWFCFGCFHLRKIRPAHAAPLAGKSILAHSEFAFA